VSDESIFEIEVSFRRVDRRKDRAEWERMPTSVWGWLRVGGPADHEALCRELVLALADVNEAAANAASTIAEQMAAVLEAGQ
jgi:hypothetical protein